MVIIDCKKGKWTLIARNSYGGTIHAPDTSILCKYKTLDVDSPKPGGDEGTELFFSSRKHTIKLDTAKDWWIKSHDDISVRVDMREQYSLVKGHSGGYTEFEADGTEVFRGNATVWGDVVNAILGRKLYSNAGKIDFNWDENALKMQPGGDITSRNDRVVFDLQYPHGAKATGSMELHCHWEQVSTDKIEWTVQYRVQANNKAKTTAWTTVVSNSTDNSVFKYPGSGTFNQITELANIDMSEAGISASVDFRVARTDSTADNILVKFLDAHVEYDMDGSREPYVK